MMDDLNTGPNSELGDRMNSCIEYSWLFGEGVAPPKLEAVGQRSLLDLKSIRPFVGGSGGGLHV
jgi:hypothetical protein